jgi:hypothetical protein
MFYSDDLQGMNFKVGQASMVQAIQAMFHRDSEDRFCVQCVSLKETFHNLKRKSLTLFFLKILHLFGSEMI